MLTLVLFDLKLSCNRCTINSPIIPQSNKLWCTYDLTTVIPFLTTCAIKMMPFTANAPIFAESNPISWRILDIINVFWPLKSPGSSCRFWYLRCFDLLENVFATMSAISDAWSMPLNENDRKWIVHKWRHALREERVSKETWRSYRAADVSCLT